MVRTESIMDFHDIPSNGAQDLLCNLAVVLLLQPWPTSLDLQRAYAFLKRLSWSSHMEIHGHHHQTSKTFLGVLEFATTALLHCHHRQSLEMDATMDSQHFLQRTLRLLHVHELEPDDTPDTGADGETGETGEAEQSRLSVGSNVTHATQVAARLQRENTMFPDTEVEERRCRQLQRIWLGTPSGRWLWSLNGNRQVFVHPRVLVFLEAGWCKWFL